MTPEERAKRFEDRMQRLSDMMGRAKDAFNKGLGKIDNAGQKFDTFVNPVDYPPAYPPAKPANDVAQKQPEAPKKKKTKKIYRF